MVVTCGYNPEIMIKTKTKLQKLRYSSPVHSIIFSNGHNKLCRKLARSNVIRKCFAPWVYTLVRTIIVKVKKKKSSNHQRPRDLCILWCTGRKLLWISCL